MNFKHLEIFNEVVKTKNFSKAAERLYISQPSVSIAINQLEQILDTTLLNRSTKFVTPTDAGQLLFTRASQMLALREQTIHDISTIDDPQTIANIQGELTVYASSLPAQYILPESIRLFNEAYQYVAVSVAMMDSAEVIKRVESHQIDFGIVGAVGDQSKCQYLKLLEDPLILIDSEPVNARSLASYCATRCFVSREKGSGTRQIYESFFKKHAVDLSLFQRVISFDNTTGVLQAVINGLGCAIVSKHAAKFYLENNLVYAVDIPQMMPTRYIYIVKKYNYQLSTISKLYLQSLYERYNITALDAL